MNTTGMTGGKAVYRVLKDAGVKTVFGLLGGSMLELYDAMYEDGGITYVGARDERAAGHMADAYARITGGPGVVLGAQAGPGVVNLVTAVADPSHHGFPAGFVEILILRLGEQISGVKTVHVRYMAHTGGAFGEIFAPLLELSVSADLEWVQLLFRRLEAIVKFRPLTQNPSPFQAVTEYFPDYRQVHGGRFTDCCRRRIFSGHPVPGGHLGEQFFIDLIILDKEVVFR